eukprot:783715-Amorphochlora_amoeboformis.AAC.1
MSTQGSFSSSHVDVMGHLGEMAGTKGLPPGVCVILHTSRGYIFWWYLVALSSVVTGIFTPLALAFFPEVQWAEIPLDVVFYIDIVLQFFVSVEIH